jgi:hypothetical protein
LSVSFSYINLDELGIATHELADLDVPFSEEVWKTIISQLPRDKVPALRVLCRFYQACWPVIKRDVMTTLSAVWSRKFRNTGALSTAYITLPPMKDADNHFKDLRPISLVHSFAKLLIKILPYRLATHVWYEVSKNRSACIKKCFIFHVGPTNSKISSSTETTLPSSQVGHHESV